MCQTLHWEQRARAVVSVLLTWGASGASAGVGVSQDVGGTPSIPLCFALLVVLQEEMGSFS